MKYNIFNKITVVSFWVLILVALHSQLPSMLNGYGEQSTEEIISKAYKLHLTDPVFSRRLGTTFCLTQIYSITNSYIASFALFSFFCWWVAGFLLYELSITKNSSKSDALLSVSVFFGNFSILFAYFAPIYSYDEPLLYVCLFGSLILLDKCEIGGFICLFLTVLVRESAFLLLPSLYLVLTNSTIERLKFRIKYIAYFCILFLGYFIYYCYIYGELHSDSGRLSAWRFNFQNAQYITETIVSVLMVLLFPILLVVLAKKNGVSVFWKNAFWLAISINTIIVLWMTLAHEARLFALPLVLFWADSGRLLRNNYVEIQMKYNKLKQKKNFLWKGIVLFVLFSAIFSFTMYFPTDSGGNNRIYQLYLFALLNISFFAVFVSILYKKYCSN